MQASDNRRPSKSAPYSKWPSKISDHPPAKQRGRSAAGRWDRTFAIGRAVDAVFGVSGAQRITPADWERRNGLEALPGMIVAKWVEEKSDVLAWRY